MDRRLILEGGFVVDDGRTRLLKERAGALGFEDLGAYLQACCDAGHSVPRIATELGVRDWQVQAALARIGVRLAPRPQRLAQQRRRHTEQRIAARVATLGFAEVRAYLVDWVVERAWLLAEVAAELAAHRRTMRRPLDSYGIRRVRRTSAERTASESGRRVQAVGWHARRAGRLAELGFQDLAGWQAHRPAVPTRPPSAGPTESSPSAKESIRHAHRNRSAGPTTRASHHPQPGRRAG